jgi:uncharacterized membrane protein YebE (DUF533 family)
MNLQNLLNQFMGSGNAEAAPGSTAQGFGNTLSKISSQLPGGLAGGAAAGGIMALLMSNKSARKFAGTAATYGGAALLGGLAYQAYRNWQQNNRNASATHGGAPDMTPAQESAFVSSETLSPDFQLTLIKAMIAVAKADGHVDQAEQERIFNAVEQMDVTTETKGLLFDLLRQPITVEELARGVASMEQKTELYLASCLVIDPDHPAECAHLEQLAQALQLPQELTQQLQWQAHQAMTQAA